MSGPRTFERYESLGVLGEGAMGTVYKARDPRLGRLVAIKAIKPEIAQRDPSFSARFQREARTVAALSHPSIVAVYDCEADYIVMEFVEGAELKQLIGRRSLSGTEIVGLVEQFASALDYAHDRGVIHRDVKPANALVTADGRLKVTDFGIAKIENAGASGITQTGQVLGTPAYMSPEQVAGKPLDRRSDQFSLAVVVYELLTGRVPFTGDSIATIVYKIIAERHPPLREFNAGLPAAIEPVLDRALAKDPAARYPTCGEFARALRSAMIEQADPSHATLAFGLASPAAERTLLDSPRAPAGPRVAPPIAARRSPALLAALGALAVLGGGGGMLYWLSSRAPVDSAPAPGEAPGSAPAARTARAPGEIQAPPAGPPAGGAAGAAPESRPSAPRPVIASAAAAPQPAPTRPALAPVPAGRPAEPAEAAEEPPAPAPASSGWKIVRSFTLSPAPGEPAGAGWGPEGELMIGDRDEGRINFYGSTGALLQRLPATTAGAGARLRRFLRRGGQAASAASAPADAGPALRRPVAAARSGDRIWISDPGQHGVVLIDRSTGASRLIGGFAEPDLIAAGPAGVAIYDREAETVTLLDGAGEKTATVSGASGLHGLLYAGGRIIAGNGDGLLTGGGTLAAQRFTGAPEAVSALVQHGSLIAVADRERRAVLFYSPGWKAAGQLEWEPLGLESPVAMVSRGEELWLLDGEGKITVLSRTP